MNRMLPYSILRNSRRNTSIFVVMILVLLASCPVKGAIKSLSGIPVNTEQGITKSNHGFFGNGSEKCVNVAAADPDIISSTSSQTNNLLPAVLLTAIFLFLLAFTGRETPSHPLYGSLKISGTLPLFLQYRKLVI